MAAAMWCHGTEHSTHYTGDTVYIAEVSAINGRGKLVRIRFRA